MNLKLKLLFEIIKLKEARANEKGIVMPAVIMLIMVGIVVGSLVLYSSFSSKDSSISEEQKTKSFYVAESAIQKSIYNLNQSSGYADEEASQWQALSQQTSFPGDYLCSASTSANARNDLILAHTSYQTLGNGKYILNNYLPDPATNTATLIVTGQYANEANSTIKVKLALTPYNASHLDPDSYYYYGVYSGDPPQTPALWAREGTTVTTSVNSINGGIYHECAQGTSTSGAITSATWITDVLSQNTGFETGFTDYKMPDPPSSDGAVDLGTWNLSNCTAILPRSATNASDCPGINWTVDDTPDSEGRYHYKFSSLTAANVKLTIPDDRKVVIHVTNDFTLNGGTPSTGAPGVDTTVYCGKDPTGTNSVYVDTAFNDISVVDETTPDPDAAKRLQMYIGGAVNITNAMVTGLVYAYGDGASGNGHVTLTESTVNGGLWGHTITTTNTSGCGAGVIAAELDHNNVSVWDQGQVSTLFIGNPLQWQLIAKPN